MDKFLLDIPVDPIQKTSLSLHQGTFDDPRNVLTGTLSSGNDHVYPTKNGIPHFFSCGGGHSSFLWLKGGSTYQHVLIYQGRLTLKKSD